MFDRISPRARGLIAVSITALCWSFLAILIKMALKDIDPYSLAWYRMATALGLLGAGVIATGNAKFLKVLIQKPSLLLVASLCLATNYIGYMKCVELTSPANAQIFIQIGPLMLAFSGLLVFKERLSRSQVFGFFICIAGFVFFFQDQFTQNQTSSENYFLGQLWVFVAASTWATFATLQKKLIKTLSSHEINLYVFATSSLVFLPMVDWSYLGKAELSSHLLFAFLGANTLLAYGALSIALKYLPATQVSPIVTLNPLGTLIILWVLEKMHWNLIPPNPISATGYIGALLAIFGTILVLRKKK